MRFIALLCLTFAVCSAMSTKQKHHMKKRQADIDLCDYKENGVAPSWMTICDEKADPQVCILTDFLCDGEEDCPNGEDEKHPQCGDDAGVDLCDMINENGVVPWWMRVCQDQAKCIFEDWVCDGEVDCFDGSDEQECPAEGEEDIDLCEFKGEDWVTTCKNGDCILKDWLCDLEEDCEDGSDELEADCAEIWATNWGPYRSGKK